MNATIGEETITFENGDTFGTQALAAAATNDGTIGSTIQISGTWVQGTDDNDYKNATLQGLTIKVNAYQDTVEYDSIDNEYDSGAADEAAREAELVKAGYAPVSTAAEIKQALANGSDVVLSEDIVLTEALTAGEGAVIDGNGKTISVGASLGNIAGSDVDVKNVNFDKEEGGSWGVYSTGVSYEDCTFTDVCPYIDPTESISVTGCTFNGQTLQLALGETKSIDVTDYKIEISNNTFIVDNASSATAHGIVINVCASNKGYDSFFTDLSNHLVFKDNTFSGTDETNEYIAFFFTGVGAPTSSDSVPTFSNTYNGKAVYALNNLSADKGGTIIKLYSQD